MNIELQSILKKTQAFLRGLEASVDEFVAKTIDKGEGLLRQEQKSASTHQPEPAQPTESNT